MLFLCEKLCTGPASRVGPARAESDRDGRELPAADGRAGPLRPERTPFFPSHYVPSGLRSITGHQQTGVKLLGLIFFSSNYWQLLAIIGYYWLLLVLLVCEKYYYYLLLLDYTHIINYWD